MDAYENSADKTIAGVIAAQVLHQKLSAVERWVILHVFGMRRGGEILAALGETL